MTFPLLHQEIIVYGQFYLPLSAVYWIMKKAGVFFWRPVGHERMLQAVKLPQFDKWSGAESIFVEKMSNVLAGLFSETSWEYAECCCTELRGYPRDRAL